MYKESKNADSSRKKQTFLQPSFHPQDAFIISSFDIAVQYTYLFIPHLDE